MWDYILKKQQKRTAAHHDRQAYETTPPRPLGRIPPVTISSPGWSILPLYWCSMTPVDPPPQYQKFYLENYNSIF